MLIIKDLSISYDDKIINNINFTVNDGGLFSLLGASGSGKSSILRFIAGLDKVDNGLVQLNKQKLSVNGKHIVQPQQRKMGMVFQDYSLFPHMNVAENITFGIYKQPKKIRQQKTKELLSLIKLEGMEKKYPHQLSGGEQQRVALARALAPMPKLLLLDEPFSHLDNDNRNLLVKQVRKILQMSKITAILVTHDQTESEIFADRIGIINNKVLEEK